MHGMVTRRLIAAVLTALVMCGCESRTPAELGDDIRREAAAGNVSEVRAMLKRDPSLVKQVDAFGATPLHAAATKGNVEVIKLLLEHKADVNARALGGLTPLHAAVSSNQPGAVVVL